MSTVVAGTPTDANGPLDFAPFGLTAEAFLRGVELGLFPPRQRVFLWDGRLYEKMAKKLPHAVTTETARLALSAALPPGWSLWGENPILVDEFTAPLPDLTVVRGTARDYFARRSVPSAADIGLVVELSDSSLRDDRTKVLAKYAAANLPVYWVVNLVDWRVEVDSDPRPGDAGATYAARASYGPGESVPFVLDGVEVARVAVTDILPAVAPG
jgi:Uma2 family endonuclease